MTEARHRLGGEPGPARFMRLLHLLVLVALACGSAEGSKWEGTDWCSEPRMGTPHTEYKFAKPL